MDVETSGRDRWWRPSRRLRLEDLQSFGSREHPHPARGGGGARQSRAALFYRQGLGGAAAPGHEGLLSRQAALPAAARRYDLEVQGDDRIPERATASALRRGACWSTPTRKACAAGVGPFTHGSAVHTEVMKTQALKQALDKYGFDAAFGGARRDEEKSRAKERIISFRTKDHRWDPKAAAARALAALQHPHPQGGEPAGLPDLQLDRARRVALHRAEKTCRSRALYFAKPRPVVERDGALIMVDDNRMPLAPGEDAPDAHGAVPHPRLLSTDRGGGERAPPRSTAIIQPRWSCARSFGTPGPGDRPRRLLHGEPRSRRAISDGRYFQLHHTRHPPA